MGILNKLFGGGTKLEMSLDATQAPAGGLLAGRLTLSGGKKKDLTLTSLKVRLVYFLVRTKEGSSLPEIATNVVLDQTLAEDEALAAGESREFAFSFRLPKELAPSGDGVSYKVMAVADIPKVADPKAEATLKVVAGAGLDDLSTLTLEDIYARWPDLQSTDETALCEALREVMLAAYSERDGLQVLEPVLAAHLRSPSTEVRTHALDAWANVLDGHARKEHIARLRGLIAELREEGGDRDFRREVIKATARFAEEGALPLIKELAASDDPAIRAEVLGQLQFAAADKFRGKLAVIEGLLEDPNDEVRAAAFSALRDFRDKKKMMQRVVDQIDRDPSPEVQVACIDVINLLHHSGQGELTLATYAKHATHHHVEVRRAIGKNLHWLPAEAAAKVHELAQTLLADGDVEVRRGTVWHFCNLHDNPQAATFATLAQRAAENDPAVKVRGDALFGMGSLVPVDALVPYYQARLQAEGDTREIGWGVLSGLRNHRDDPAAVELLRDLTRSSHGDLARAAREALGED